MRVLVLNSGSSSLKFQLFAWPQPKPVLRGTIDRIGEEESTITVNTSAPGSAPEKFTRALRDHEEALAALAELLTRHGEGGEIDVVGHRVVHGGERFYLPTVITPAVLEEIRCLSPLAPLHNPPNVIGIEGCLARFSRSKQVAVFDTGFHHTLPEVAYRYAIPEEFFTGLHVRRFGFHGTSHGYVAREAAALLNRDLSSINLISLHLGNGASACAIRGGKSIDTSLGFTPLEGLVMGTRSGDLDPAIPFFLTREAKIPWEKVEEILNTRSGLRGLCGANDMRDILERIDLGDAKAKLALDIFCYRIKKYIGGYSAVLGALDAIIFTAGIGERSAAVRSAVCSGLEILGVTLSEEKNRAVSGAAAAIQTHDSKVAVLVIPTNEELEIARQSVECVLRTKG